MPGLIIAKDGADYLYITMENQPGFIISVTANSPLESLQSVQAFMAALNNGGDLTQAAAWVQSVIPYNPLDMPATWDANEAMTLLRAMLSCDKLAIAGDELAAATFLATRMSNGAETLEECVIVAADDFSTDALALLAAL